MEELWHLQNGAAVELISPIEILEPDEEVMALADTPQEALKLAESYDKGNIQPDNHMWESRVFSGNIVCLKEA